MLVARNLHFVQHSSKSAPLQALPQFFSPGHVRARTQSALLFLVSGFLASGFWFLASGSYVALDLGRETDEGVCAMITPRSQRQQQQPRQPAAACVRLWSWTSATADESQTPR
jgi:hypothetical protein